MKFSMQISIFAYDSLYSGIYCKEMQSLRVSSEAKNLIFNLSNFHCFIALLIWYVAFIMIMPLNYADWLSLLRYALFMPNL